MVFLLIFVMPSASFIVVTDSHACGGHGSSYSEYLFRNLLAVISVHTLVLTERFIKVQWIIPRLRIQKLVTSPLYHLKRTQAVRSKHNPPKRRLQVHVMTQHRL